MQQEGNYTLLLLDLNSIDVNVKLEALNKVKTLPEKEVFRPVLSKLAKHKNDAVKNMAQMILNKMDNQPATIEIPMPEGETSLESYVLEQFEGIINSNDFEYFKPYIQDKPMDKAKKPLPAELKEKVHKYLNNQDPFIRLKALFPIACMPLEYKFKVNVLVDLLRDKSPSVISYTLKHLPILDKEIVQRTVPIIVDKVHDPSPEVYKELKNYLLTLNKPLFEPELNLLETEGISIKLKKSMTNHLFESLK